MINGRTYYQILGVLEDAEDIVIRAAYKVLAQKYHPDKWSGTKDEATQKMSEINQAYAVLSNSEKRKQYDKDYTKEDYSSTYESSTADDSLDDDWRSVVEYYPDLVVLAKTLRQISVSLEYTFKLMLLEQKNFEKRDRVAQELEKRFLERYFGSNKEILKFAKFLIIEGHKDAAKELNKAITLLGSGTEPSRVVARISEKYLKSKTTNRQYSQYEESELTKAARKFLAGGDNPYTLAKHFLLELGGVVYSKGFFKITYTVNLKGETQNFLGIDFLKYTRVIAEKVLRGEMKK